MPLDATPAHQADALAALLDALGIDQIDVIGESTGASGLGGIDIYVSALVEGVFQPPTPVAELNTPQFDLTPSIRHDGLEIAFASDRPGGVGGRDLWSATRSSVNGTWSTPVNFGR